MSAYKILFFRRYANPFDAVPYNTEVDFEASSVVEAVRRLKNGVSDFARGRGYELHETKGYLLKATPGQKRQWKWLKVAAYPSRESRTVKVWNLKTHTEESDPTISYMNLGRRNFR